MKHRVLKDGFMEKLKILHAEDDDGDAIEVKRACSKEFGTEHFLLVRVDTLLAAIEKIHEEPFNTILLDLNLNDSSGLENVRAIHQANPDIPIVVLSGHDDTETALNAIRGGAQEYLVKGHLNSRVLGLAIRSSIERKAYERHLFGLANKDELTGLANRRAFLDYLNQSIMRATRWQRSECVMFMDVNRFKLVNDTLGHDVGDLLLKEIAALLRTQLRASDMVARFGGDEFVVHLDTDSNIAHEDGVKTAQKISDAFRGPLSVGGHEIQTGVSIGIAFYPEHGRDTATIIQNADEAMYRAKKSGQPYAVYCAPER